jgi:hypothetical protein
MVTGRRPIEDPYKKAEQDLILYVQEKISMMEDNLLFSGQSEPGIYQLNQSLMNYESVMLGLITIHAEVRMQLDIAKERFDEFYAKKYVEVKQEQAALGKSAMFTAQREIELYVRNNFLSEIAMLKSEIIRMENQKNLVDHLIDSWKNYQFVLSTLSKNSQAEAAASGVSKNNPKEWGDEQQ